MSRPLTISKTPWNGSEWDHPMRRLKIRLLVVVLTWYCQGVHAQKQSVQIEALLKAPSRVGYSSDGAADATVMDVGNNGYGMIENPIPEVADVVKLGASVIPPLIDCLDDPRPSSATFNALQGNPSWRVPIGHVCLDILTHLTDPPGVSVKDCADDGLGACVNEGYYFPPDAYLKQGSKYIPKREVA